MRRAGGWQLRFQKHIQLMKGVRLNVGKRGFGVTVGGRLARFGVTSRGQVYQSASIPGTGVSIRRKRRTHGLYLLPRHDSNSGGECA
jgi:hypothetical protein